MYGPRCNFKHDERKLEDMERSYFTLMINSLPHGQLHSGKRLKIFENTCKNNSESQNSQILNIQSMNNINVILCQVTQKTY